MKPREVNQRRLGNRAFGFSLLEMVMAAVLVTGTVVPALSVIRDSMTKSRDLHRQKLLANYTVYKLEKEAAEVASLDGAAWVTAVSNSPYGGDFSVEGFSSLRYTVTQSDDPTNGGIVGKLMNIEVTVYDDANGDDTFDTGEIQETYRTKVAFLNSYHNEEQ